MEQSVKHQPGIFPMSFLSFSALDPLLHITPLDVRHVLENLAVRFKKHGNLVQILMQFKVTSTETDPLQESVSS